MVSVSERRIKALIIILTLLLHAGLLYIFFILARKEASDTLRITPQPQIIEYLLNSLSQQNNQAQKALPPAQALYRQQLAQAQMQQQLDEDGVEQYMLKNAVSYGSYNQGSIVSMGQEGTGGNKTQQAEQEPEKQEPQSEPAKPDVNDTTDKTQQEPLAQEPAIQKNTQKNEPAEQVIDPTTGSTPAIAQAEEILNETGSSWITPSQIQKPTTTQSATHVTQQPLRQPASTTQKQAGKQLTLADITRGYIKQMRQEQDSTGHCTYNQGGTGTGSICYGVNAPPTDGAALSEQLYASKLYNLLEQSAQAYSSQIYSCHDLEMETMIEVTIEKSGKILDVALRPALPEKDMERALCLIVQRVGLFPPIPRQFRKQRIVLSIPIRIRSQSGFASYRLLYGLRSA